MLTYHIKGKKPAEKNVKMRLPLTSDQHSQSDNHSNYIRQLFHICAWVEIKNSIICTRWMEFYVSLSFAPMIIHEIILRGFLFSFSQHTKNSAIGSIPFHWMQQLCTDDGHTSKRTRSIYIVISQTIAFLLSNVSMYCVRESLSVYQWRHWSLLLLLLLLLLVCWQKRRRKETHSMDYTVVNLT